jgi:hypothetical protein
MVQRPTGALRSQVLRQAHACRIQSESYHGMLLCKGSWDKQRYLVKPNAARYVDILSKANPPPKLLFISNLTRLGWFPLAAQCPSPPWGSLNMVPTRVNLLDFLPIFTFWSQLNRKTFKYTQISSRITPRSHDRGSWAHSESRMGGTQHTLFSQDLCPQYACHDAEVVEHQGHKAY